MQLAPLYRLWGFLICTKFDKHDTMLYSLLEKQNKTPLLDPARTKCGAEKKGT